MSKRRLTFALSFAVLLWPMWLVIAPGGKGPLVFAWDFLWICMGAALLAAIVTAFIVNRLSRRSMPPPPRP